MFLSVISCAPKLKSNIVKTLPALDENTLVVVLSVVDEQKVSAELIGEIKAIDNGFSNNCSYYEGVKNLKILARKAGANLVKITKYKPANSLSTCDRLWANIYKVDNPKDYEKEITWSSNRKLTWDDFKGRPDTLQFPNALAVTHSGFGYESSSISVFKNSKLFVQTVFNTDKSWVLPEGRNDYVLKHEQIHFDITEIYSRILRKALSDSNITSTASGKASAIFSTVFFDYKKRQQAYDEETKHGLKQETQEKWEAIVAIELAKYDFYKSN